MQVLPLRATNCTLRLLVTDPMQSQLSQELQEYLTVCGISKRKIALCSADTRMFHDLGIYGDIAETCIEILEQEYHVDMSGFNVQSYFPAEHVGKTRLAQVLLWAVPFAGNIARRNLAWEPLTLSRIERVMQAKKWAEAD
jgi:hypothetical protein